MRFKIFEKSINELLDFYNEASDRDRKLEKALGGDTVVMTDWWDKHLTTSLNIIRYSMRLPEDDDTIDWLFFDVLCSSNPEDYIFTEGDIKYKATIKNIWLNTKGKLDERVGDLYVEPKEVDMTHVPTESGNDFDWNKPETFFARVQPDEPEEFQGFDFNDEKTGKELVEDLLDFIRHSSEYKVV